MARDLFAESAPSRARDLFAEAGIATAPKTYDFDTMTGVPKEAPLARSIPDARIPTSEAEVRREEDRRTGDSISARGPIDPSMDSLARGVGANVRQMGESVQQAVDDAIAPSFLTPGQRAASSAMQLRETQQAQIDTQQARPEFDSEISSGLYGALESTIQQFPGIAASIATGNIAPGVAWAGLTTSAQGYGKYRARGGTPGEAAAGASGEGGVEILTELIPMGRFLKAFGREGGKHFLTEAGKAVLVDVPGEQIATLAQDAIDTAIANPDKTWGDYLKERPSAALETLVATVGQGAIMTGGGYAANRLMNGAGEQTPAYDPVTGQAAASAFDPNVRGPNVVPLTPTDPAPQPTTPGVVETAEAAAIDLTPDDDASPYRNEDVAAGKRVIAGANAQTEADGILAQHAAPKVGTRVVVDLGGKTQIGTVRDAYVDDSDAELGAQAGVHIDLDTGQKLRASFDDLRDSGAVIRPLDEVTAVPAAGAAREEPAPVQAPPPKADGGRDGFMRRVRGAESGGNDQAKNDSSSASGRYQFTKGTWEALGGDWANRFDAGEQERLMKKLTDQNEAALRGAGVPLTSGNYYLAHFAGPGGAVQLHRSPDASAEAILGAGAVKANPFLAGMKGRDVIAWAARKMGGEAGAVGPASSTDEARPDDRIEFAASTFAEGTKPEDLKLAAGIEQGVAQVAAPKGDIAGPAIDKEWSAFTPESGTIGIPRADMPQIKAEHRGALVNFLNARGIAHEEVTVPADSLKPSQAEFSPAKVQAAVEYEGGDRAILISSDGHIVDGHHQWLAARNAGEDVRAIRLDAPITDVLSAAHAFPSSVPSDTTPAPQRTQDNTDALRIEPTSSGKGISVSGLTEAQKVAITAAVPKITAMAGKDGALVFSKKYEDAIRAAVAAPAAEPTARTEFTRADAIEAVNSGQNKGSGQISLGEQGDLTVRMPSGAMAVIAPATSDIPEAEFRNLLNIADRISRIAGVSEERAQQLAAQVAGDGGAPTVAPAEEAPALNPDGGGQSPIVRLREKAAGIERAQPPVPEGQTRLWRAERPGADGKGLNFTNDLPGIALPFHESYGGNLNYIEVPTADLTKYEMTGAVAPGAEFHLPTELATKAERALIGEYIDRERRVARVASDRLAELRNDNATGNLSDEDGVEFLDRAAKAKPAATGKSAVAKGERYEVSEAVAYLSPGRTYTIERVDRKSTYFRSDEGGGTSVPAWQIRQAVESGTLRRVDSEQSNTEAPKPTPSPNTVFTEDAADLARAKLKHLLSRTSAGLDPEMVQAGITLAGYHIERGARTFAAYAKAMIGDLGDKVTPYLRGWYEAVRYHPGMTDAAREMSSPDEIAAWTAEAPEAEARPSTESADPITADEVAIEEAGEPALAATPEPSAAEPSDVKSGVEKASITDGATPLMQAGGPSVSRRNFLAGATAVAGGFMFEGKLYAKPAGLLSILDRSTDGPIELSEGVRWLAENSANPQFRRFAAKILPFVKGVTLRSVQWQTPDGMDGDYGAFIYNGTDVGGLDKVPYEIGSAAHGLYLTSASGEDQVWLAKRPQGAPDRMQGARLDGFNEATLIHEALHAAIDRQFGRLSVRLAGNEASALREEGLAREAAPRPANKADLDLIRDIWRKANDAFKAKGDAVFSGDSPALSRLESVSAGIALANPDEMLSWALEDPAFQNFLRSIPAETAPGGQARSQWDRFVDWVRRLFGAGMVSRTALDDVLDATSRLLDSRRGAPVEPSGSGNRQAASKRFNIAGDFSTDARQATFRDPATEKRWNDATKGVGSGPALVEKARDWWADLTVGFTRHWKDLPNEPRFSDLAQQLRKLEAAPDAAMEASVRYLRDLVGKMDRAEYDLFSRKVVMDDLAWEAAEDHDLPFGLTPTALVAELAKINRLMAQNPKLLEALNMRKAHNRTIANAMVAAGVLSEKEVRNPAYFRHMVLDYARTEAALARGSKNIKSPYWARRMGSALDINANLLEAELDWMQKAQIDIATANTIEWIKKGEHNIREPLRTDARARNKAAMDEMIAADPSLGKTDAEFRKAMGHGFGIVRKALESGYITGVPRYLQSAADSVESGKRGEGAPFEFFAWLMDNKQPGAMGAAMVLKAVGQRKAWVRETLGDSFLDTEDIGGLIKKIGPKGFKAWQPIAGRHLLTAKTMTEHALDKFVSGLADTAIPGVSKEELYAALGPIRQQLVVGGDRYTMALPDEVADTLTEFGDRRSEGMVGQVFGSLQSAWKRWILINPRRFLKYNINNLSGDLDAIIAGNPGTLAKVGRAWAELRAASKGDASQIYTDAMERGVFTSGLSVQEIPDINRLSSLRHLTDESGALKRLTLDRVGTVWRALNDVTQFRENLFRLAAYIDYSEKIDAGLEPLKMGYGASVPAMVDAVSDPKDKAALLARDLVGDYGSVSVAGSWLRKYLIPFWSWTEINTKRYWRLTSNAYSISKGRGIATGGVLGAGIAARVGVGAVIRMGMLYAVLNLWNNLFFGDEEDELGDLQKRQMHLILGRDSEGEIMTLRLQGALSDVLSILGFPSAVAGFKAYMNDQGTLGQVGQEVVKAPINRVLTGTTPLASVPLQLAQGREWWPDFFNGREIKDNYRFVTRTFSLENEYDVVADKPSRGYGRSWAESLIYKRDPGEMAYDTAKGITYDWLKNVKGQDGGTSSSPRSLALRDYRLGLRYDDQDAAEKALVRYDELGGTDESLRNSINRQHPLGPIAKKDRAEFIDSLTDEQYDVFIRAEEWFEEVYLGEEEIR